MNSSQYPENRLHIVIDENGNVSYRQDPEFLKYYAPTAEELREELMGLPQDEIEERLDFYSEMIEDRMEEGLSEEVAVAEIGIPAEIAAQITEGAFGVPVSDKAKIPLGQAHV